MEKNDTDYKKEKKKKKKRKPRVSSNKDGDIFFYLLIQTPVERFFFERGEHFVHFLLMNMII